MDNLEYRLENAALKKKIREHFRYTYQFERIHPFSDGNGRTAYANELLIAARRISPLIIEKETKATYRATSKTRFKWVYVFANTILVKEQKRMQYFQNMDQRMFIRIKPTKQFSRFHSLELT